MLDSATNQSQRWQTMMIQARRFAEGEQYSDGVARVRLALKELQSRATDTQDLAELRQLAQLERRAKRLLEELTRQQQQWSQAIARQRQRTFEQAAEEMKRPLPR